MRRIERGGGEVQVTCMKISLLEVFRLGIEHACRPSNVV